MWPLTLLSRAVATVRQPEYTGTNRCLPCTIINLLLAAGASGLVAIVSVPAAAVAFVLCVVLVYFRGYLIPGTPQLTKRYLPEWVLARFDSHPAASTSPHDEDSDPLDPEALLREAGVVVPCEDRVDVCLTDEFRKAWRERMRTVDEPHVREVIAEALGVKEKQLSFRQHGPAVVATDGGQPVGQWESPAARIADVATSDALTARYDGWDDLAVTERGRLLKVFRIFVEECPACGGTVSVEQKEVESCCRSLDVVASTCDTCGARILEQELTT
jgi:hypothetical protein